jgi:hypothetical protein
VEATRCRGGHGGGASMRWRRSRLVTDGEAADVGHADVEVVSRGGGGAVDREGRVGWS